MATGGDVPGKKEMTDSGVQVDCPCCICSKKKIRTEADKYCVSCGTYYCKECVKFHELMPFTEGHVLVGKSDYKGDCTGDKLPSVPTERCELHKLKIVDMMCNTHEQVGCVVCMATKHKE